MPETLLRTKLFVPPLRPNLVPRPKQIAFFSQGLELGHKLTLVSAPAGFGKTTLVAAFIHNSQTIIGRAQTLNSNFAWLSLDEHDNDITRFLTYLPEFGITKIDGEHLYHGYNVFVRNITHSKGAHHEFSRTVLPCR